MSASCNYTPPASPGKCSHHLCDGSLKIRKRTTAANVEILQYQCLACGGPVGNALKKAPILAWAKKVGLEIEPFDTALWEKTEQARRNKTHAAGLRVAQEQAQWSAFYENYLKSQRWKSKRQRVIERCNNVCEGCDNAPVSEVHHLTYDRLGAELLLDLAGLCHDCHSAAHAGKSELWRTMTSLDARWLK